MPVPREHDLDRRIPAIALAATAVVVTILIGIGLLVRAHNVGPSPMPGPTHNVGPSPTPGATHNTSATWTATGSMVVARSGHTATLLPDGKVLVAGGSLSVQSSAELYDPSTGTWAATGNMVVARSGHTATLLPDGKVLVAGGFDVTKAPGIGGSPEIVATAELYDPSTEIWSATGIMSTARRDHTATRLINGKVLVVGGYRNAIPGGDERGPEGLKTAELYDPGTGTWSATGSMSTYPRADHSATLLPDGKVLIEYGVVQGAELYDPSTATWTAVWSPDIGGFVTATLLADGTVLTTFELRDTALYDSATGSWTYPQGIGREHLTLSGDGIFGAGATATLLDDGTVLVAGGALETREAGTVTVQTWRQAELFHPGSVR